MSTTPLEEIKIMIRSILNTSPGPITIRDLDKYYSEFGYNGIPYLDFNHRNILQFLLSLKDVVKVHDPKNTNSFVSVIASEKSGHIHDLVVGQKQTYPKKSHFRPPYRPPSRPVFTNYRGRQRIKQPITFEFRNDLYNCLEPYENGMPYREFENAVQTLTNKHHLDYRTSEILNKVSDLIEEKNNRIYIKSDKRRTKDDIYDDAAANRPYHADGIDTSSDNDSVYYDDEAASTYQYSDSHEELQDDQNDDTQSILRTPTINENFLINIQILLEETNGFWLEDFEKLYERRFGYPLALKEHGFNDPLDLVFHLPEIIHSQQFRISGSYFLTDARKHETDNIANMQPAALPKSFINEIMTLMKKQRKFFTDELLDQYRTMFNKNMRYKEFGIDSEDALLKCLHDTCCDITFRTIGSRTLMLLEEENNEQPINTDYVAREDALPGCVDYDPIPAEACNIHFILKEDPDFENMKIGSKFPVVLGEIYHPGHFYIHLEEKCNLLDRLMDDLNQFYNEYEKSYTVFPGTVSRNLLCVAKYSQDNRWHRSKVILSEKMTVTVNFIDYGTTSKKMGISEIRYLHKDFAKLPPMCKKAKLLGIKPKQDLSCSNGSYSTLAISAFYKMCFDNGSQNLQAELVTTESIGWGILLHLRTEKRGTIEQVIVHEKLIDMDLVDRKKIPATPLSAPSSLNGDPPRSTINTPMDRSTSAQLSDQVHDISHEKISNTESCNLTPKQTKSQNQTNRLPPGISLPGSRKAPQSSSRFEQTIPENTYEPYRNPNLAAYQSTFPNYNCYNIPQHYSNIGPPPGFPPMYTGAPHNTYIPPSTMYSPYPPPPHPPHPPPPPSAYVNIPPFIPNPVPTYIPNPMQSYSDWHAKSFPSPVIDKNSNVVKGGLSYNYESPEDNNLQNDDDVAELMRKMMELLYSKETKKESHVRSRSNKILEDEKERKEVEMKVIKYLNSFTESNSRSAQLSYLDSKSDYSHNSYSHSNESLITARTRPKFDDSDSADEVSKTSSSKFMKLKEFVKQHSTHKLP